MEVYYCLFRTWSRDQLSSKERLGNIIFVLDALMLQVRLESTSKGKKEIRWLVARQPGASAISVRGEDYKFGNQEKICLI